MESSLADRPATAAPAGAGTSDAPPGAPTGPWNGADGSFGGPGPQAGATPAVPSCPRCGSAMAPGQDWCLQCGAGVQGSLGQAGWRSGAAILAVAAALLLGAAAAGYAALSKGTRRAPVVTQTVAQAPPATTPPAATPPATPNAFPTLKTAKPPKIPLTASTPKATIPTTPSPAATTPTTGTGTGTGTGGSESTGNTGGASGEGTTKAILLDTNAASTYNPYNYPASNFGDPALAIDGDESTGWTAKVQAATAPRLAEGLLIDLRKARRIAALSFVTTTPGMTVQVYGSAAKTLPTSITDKEGWVALSHTAKDKKKSLRIKLRDSTSSFRWITLWISRAPAGSTPEKPGRVTVNEVELFPPGN